MNKKESILREFALLCYFFIVYLLLPKNAKHPSFLDPHPVARVSPFGSRPPFLLMVPSTSVPNASLESGQSSTTSPRRQKESSIPVLQASGSVSANKTFQSTESSALN